MNKIVPFFILVLIVVSCRKEYYGNDDLLNRPTYSYSGKFVRDYFMLICKISQSTPGFFPPQVARAYGWIGIANYEAVVHGIQGAQTLTSQLNGLSETKVPVPVTNARYNWSITSNAAIAGMVRKMFELNITTPNIHSLDSIEQHNLSILSASENPEVVARSVDFGKSVAASVYQMSVTDGGHHSYLDPYQLPFVMPPDPGCWVPTGIAKNPISPYWGNNRPFIQASVTNALQNAPKTFSSAPGSAFYEEAMAVYKQVKNNTADQVTIAKYWADDPYNTCTPAGHTFNIMTQLLEETNATLEKTAVAYAKLCIAENDAFISCWKGKYKYILIRPVSYIQRYIDPSFNTIIGSPAFPAFTSGHSAEIGAGSQIFIDMFTDGSGNYSFTDYSQLQYGFAARSYQSFHQMAEECANSRLYAGIHFPMDNSFGLQLGRSIGDNVNKMINWPKNIR